MSEIKELHESEDNKDLEEKRKRLKQKLESFIQNKYTLFLFITNTSKVFFLPTQEGYVSGQKYVPFTPAYAPDLLT